MPLSAGQQIRARARKALLAGASFEARGEANKRLLEEVRAEVEKGKESVRDEANKGVERMQQEEARLKDQLKDQLKAEGAVQRRLLEEKAASLEEKAASGQPPRKARRVMPGSSTDPVPAAVRKMRQAIPTQGSPSCARVLNRPRDVSSS